MSSDQKSGLITQGVVPLFRSSYPDLQENWTSGQHQNLKIDFGNFSLERARRADLTRLIIFVEKFS